MHRWTGRFEAHLWDKGTWNPTQKKKVKQGGTDAQSGSTLNMLLYTVQIYKMSSAAVFLGYLRGT
jgi:hypothetical protein